MWGNEFIAGSVIATADIDLTSAVSSTFLFMDKHYLQSTMPLTLSTGDKLYSDLKFMCSHVA